MSAVAATGAAAVGEAPAPARRGRPRRADADEAILSAALEILAEVGVGGLSMDELAQRAGVGKATIYRRWTSKEALVLDALHTATTPIPTPDEGALRADLITYTDALIERFGAGRGSDVLPHLIAASCYDDHLRASLDEYTRARQATIRLILRRGIERGELPDDTDLDLLVDVILGPFFYRHLLTGAPLDRDFSRRLVDLVVR
jgi:AcrR family transcriptional regulator